MQWYESGPLLTLIGTVVSVLVGAGVTCFTIIRQGVKVQVIGDKAASAAEAAAVQAADAAWVGRRTLEAGQNTEKTVNGRWSHMEAQIVALRAEIAALQGQPRPSDAVLGVPPNRGV